MKNLAAALLLLLGVLTAPAVSHALILDQFQKVNLPEVLREVYGAADGFMEEYYLTKPANKAGNFLVLLDRSNMLEQYSASEPPIAAFMSVLFSQNKNRTLEWLMPQRPYKEKTVDMLQHALWLAGRHDEIDLKKLFARHPAYLSKKSPPLGTAAVKNKEDIGMLWGAFLATGDMAYAAPVADACAEDDTTTLAKEACASLKTFTKRHYIALRVLKNKLTTDTNPKRKARLETALPPPNAHLPVMDGDFGAQLVIADLTAIANMPLRTNEEIIRLPVKKQARPGERAAFLLIFTGMALDDNQTAHLDFDLTVTDPKGNPVLGMDLKKQRVTPNQFRTGYGLHNHGRFMGLYFKKRDIPGIYTVTTVVRDNLSHKKVTLTGKIHFLK